MISEDSEHGMHREDRHDRHDRQKSISIRAIYYGLRDKCMNPLADRALAFPRPCPIRPIRPFLANLCVRPIDRPYIRLVTSDRPSGGHQRGHQPGLVIRRILYVPNGQQAPRSPSVNGC